MKRFFLFLFLFSFIFPSLLFSGTNLKHETENIEVPKYFFGIAVSHFLSYGLSFQYRVSPRYQLKIQGMAHYKKYHRIKVDPHEYEGYGMDEEDIEEEDEDLDWDYTNYGAALGAVWQTNLHQTRRSRFYWYGGTNFLYDEKKDYTYSFEYHIKHDLRFSLGLGAEFLLGNCFAFNFDIGTFSTMYWGKKFSHRSWEIWPLSLGFGVHYAL